MRHGFPPHTATQERRALVARARQLPKHVARARVAVDWFGWGMAGLICVAAFVCGLAI